LWHDAANFKPHAGINLQCRAYRHYNCVMPQTTITVVWGCDFAFLLAATNVVAASINKSGVVVVDICSRVGGFFVLSVSKDDELTYDFKCGCHFLKMILISKSQKRNFKFLTFLDLKY
jgi:hypothetical protein